MMTQTYRVAIQKARGHGGYGAAVAVVEVEADRFFTAQDMVCKKLYAGRAPNGSDIYTFNGLKVGGFGSPDETKGGSTAPVIKFSDLTK